MAILSRALLIHAFSVTFGIYYYSAVFDWVTFPLINERAKAALQGCSKEKVFRKYAANL